MDMYGFLLRRAAPGETRELAHQVGGAAAGGDNILYMVLERGIEGRVSRAAD
jgi:hypothetical protein